MRGCFFKSTNISHSWRHYSKSSDSSFHSWAGESWGEQFVLEKDVLYLHLFSEQPGWRHDGYDLKLARLEFQALPGHKKRSLGYNLSYSKPNQICLDLLSKDKPDIWKANYSDPVLNAQSHREQPLSRCPTRRKDSQDHRGGHFSIELC